MASSARLAAGLPRGVALVLLAVGVAAGVPRSGQGAEPESKSDGRPRFEQVAFDDLMGSGAFTDPKQLEALLEPIPGFKSSIAASHSHNKKICRITGLLRWKKPWPAGTALRLSIVPHTGFQIHLWRGEQGVTLRYHDDPFKLWAAFGTMRERGKPQPSQRALWATDNDRYRRSGQGTFQLHWADGRLVMTRGDIRLLTVPLASPPSEVYLDGAAMVHGLETFSVEGLPPDWDAGRIERRPLELAESAWQLEAESGYSLDKLPDGGLQLTADEKSPEGQASVSVGGPELYDFVFQVDDPQPGTGIFLGDREGNMLGRIAFLQETHSKQTAFALLRPDQRDLQRTFDERRLPIPFTGPRPWLRVVVGGGLMRVFISADGVHWSLPDPAVLDVSRGCCRIGLYCLAGEKPRAIRLRRASVGQLDRLTGFAQRPLRKRLEEAARAEDFSEEDRLARAGKLEDWEERVAALRPEQVEAKLWRRACLVHTLSDGAHRHLAAALLDSLLEEALSESRDTAEQLALLDEAALLMYGLDWSGVDRCLAAYRLLGWTVEDRREVDPFPVVQRRLISSRFWGERQLPGVPEALLWYDLLRRVSEERWEDVAVLCRRLRYMSRLARFANTNPPWSVPLQKLVAAVEERAGRHVEGLAPDRPRKEHVNGRHPLIEQWSKEGYNVKAEFRAALDGGGYREACQVISSCRRAAMEGLLPDDRDPRLLTSLPVMIAGRMNEMAPLRRTMQEELNPLGQLRLKQAVAAGDVAVVEAVSFQFTGSEAGADAERWLGDRHLAGGRFAQAAGCYRRSLHSVGPSRRDDVLARYALAEVMQGRSPPERLAGPVEFGGRRLSGAEFERLLKEMGQTHGVSGESPSAGGDACPPPGHYEVRAWAQIEGAGAGKPDGVSSKEVDWAARETAVRLTDARMLVDNRFEQIAFTLTSGAKAWYYRQSGGAARSGWPLAAAWPVPVGERIFVRRQGEGKPELACLQRESGELVHSSSLTEATLSDVLVAGRWAWAFSVDRIMGQKSMLVLVRIDAVTGQPLERVPVVEFYGFLDPIALCQAVIAEDRILASVGGTLLCCDFSGRLQWVRRLAWFDSPGRATYDSKPWIRQIASGPLAVDGRVYATQPGAWSIECCDLASGRLAWRTTLSGLVGLVGMVGDRLIVQTDGAVLGLDRQTGDVIWRHRTKDRLEGIICGLPGGVLYAERRPNRDANVKEPEVALVWLHPSNGEISGESILATPRHAEPLVGPLVTDGKRLWALFGVADDSARRQILELVPAPQEP